MHNLSLSWLEILKINTTQRNNYFLELKFYFQMQNKIWNLKKERKTQV